MSSLPIWDECYLPDYKGMYIKVQAAAKHATVRLSLPFEGITGEIMEVKPLFAMPEGIQVSLDNSRGPNLGCSPSLLCRLA